jgi:hypothetical protein
MAGSGSVHNNDMMALLNYIPLWVHIQNVQMCNFKDTVDKPNDFSDGHGFEDFEGIFSTHIIQNLNYNRR